MWTVSQIKLKSNNADVIFVRTKVDLALHHEAKLSKKMIDEQKFIESVRQNASSVIQSSYTSPVCVVDSRDINLWDGQKLIDSVISWSQGLKKSKTSLRMVQKVRSSLFHIIWLIYSLCTVDDNLICLSTNVSLFALSLPPVSVKISQLKFEALSERIWAISLLSVLSRITFIDGYSLIGDLNRLKKEINFYYDQFDLARFLKLKTNEHLSLCKKPF